MDIRGVKMTTSFIQYNIIQHNTIKIYKAPYIASKSETHDDDGSTGPYISVNKNDSSFRLEQGVMADPHNVECRNVEKAFSNS